MINTEQTSTLKHIQHYFTSLGEALKQPVEIKYEIVGESLMVSIAITAPRWYMNHSHYMVLIGRRGGMKYFTENNSWRRVQRAGQIKSR